MRKLACVSVDLVGLPSLCRRYGVAPSSLPPAGHVAVGERAPERFAELLDRRGLPATFFAEAEELDLHGDAIGSLAGLGHELALLGGDGLSSLPRPDLAAAIRRGGDAVARASGAEPAGFRAADGEVSPVLLEELELRGFLYDSSVAVGIGVRAPYRPSPRDPRRRGSAKLVELPAGHTWITSSPKAVATLAWRAVRTRAFLCLRLRGIDLLDESDGFGHELAAKARTFRLPVSTKRQRLGEFLDWLRDDFEFSTLAQASSRLAPSL